MSMTIGRCAITEDPDAGSLRQRGDEVSFRSMLAAADVDEFKARVQQLRGLMNNPDEDVFPFTWSEDSSFDGFYTDIDVEVEDSAVMLTTGVAPFRVRMRRVSPVGSSPSIDCPGVRLTRTNDHAIASQAGQWSVPASATAAESPDGLSKAIAVATRTTDTGALRTFFWDGSGVSSGRFIVAPADHYVGSALVESKGVGSTFYAVHGRQAALSPTNWRLLAVDSLQSRQIRDQPAASGRLREPKAFAYAQVNSAPSRKIWAE